MAGKNAIQKLSVRHESIMNAMIAEPDVKLGDLARRFGVTQAWLSTVIHTDLFQHQLREKMDDMWGEHLTTVGDKLNGIAHRTLDKILDKVDHVEDTGELQRLAEMALKGTGYGTGGGSPSGSGSTTNNILVVQDREALAQARGMIGRQPQVLNHEGSEE